MKILAVSQPCLYQNKPNNKYSCKASLKPISFGMTSPEKMVSLTNLKQGLDLVYAKELINVVYKHRSIRDPQGLKYFPELELAATEFEKIARKKLTEFSRKYPHVSVFFPEPSEIGGTLDDYEKCFKDSGIIRGALYGSFSCASRLWEG